jgi:hypothetical protein
MSSTIGHVAQERYDQLVAEGRELVEVQTRCQFALGDKALESEPMRPHGGSVAAAEETFLVSTSLQIFADDLAMPVASLRTYRWVAARWPAAHRRPKVSCGIHQILAAISDETKRYATITDPLPHTRTGERRWTEDPPGARSASRSSTRSR